MVDLSRYYRSYCEGRMSFLRRPVGKAVYVEEMNAFLWLG